MNKLLHIVLIFLFCLPGHAQKNTLSGIVYDAKTRETLIGASLLLNNESNIGTVTDQNGFFSLPNILQQTIEINVSYLGYEKKLITIQFTDSHKQFIEIRLKAKSIDLNEVTVTELSSLRVGDREIETSYHSLSPKTILSIPTARNDVFKAIRFLPGIEATEPLSPLVSVRGGDPSENLIMLDGVTVYNPYHFLASSGMFNMSTIKNVDLLVGGFGAEYGGRNSSVINLTTKDGSQDGLHGEVEPSIVESKVFLEFPVSPKTTMMIAGRLNYDIMYNFVLLSNNYFYDANISLTHRFNPKNRIDIKYFGSKDHTSLNYKSFYSYMGYTLEPYVDSIISKAFTDMDFIWENRWRNNIGTIIWKSVISPKIYFRLQGYASLHSANNFTAFKMDIEDAFFNTSTNFNSKVYDFSTKASVNYTPMYGNEIKVGIEYNKYHFENEYKINRVEGKKAQSSPWIFSGFIEDKIKFKNLIIRPGVRFSSFNQNKINTESRVNMGYSLNKGWKIKAAFGQYYQYLNSMNTQELEFSQFLDYYYPLINVKPSYSIHYIAGLEKKIGKSQQLHVDFYFKDIARTYTFDLMQSQFEAFAFSNKIIEGEGKSYGVEILWKGYINKISGWSSYTLAHSTRSFPNIMNGDPFTYDYDHLHTLKGVLNFQVSKRTSYSADFIIQSGMPRSVENTFQMFYSYNPVTGQMNYSPQYTIDQKNSSRMPWTMSINLGIKKQIVKGFGKDLASFFNADESYLLVNIRNLLFLRRNVSYYFPLLGEEDYLPMGFNYIPSVSTSYTIKF